MRGHLDGEADVVVVGGGPVGCLLALMLDDRGRRVTVLEARPDPRRRPLPGGRSINLTLSERGWQGLRAAGAEDAIRAISMPLRGRMIHADDGQTRFQPYTPQGDAIHSASREAVTQRLLDMVDARPGIRMRFGH